MMCAVLRERVKPAFKTVSPAMARGMSRTSGRAMKKRESGVTFIPLLGKMLARYQNEANNFNGEACQAEHRLGGSCVKQDSGGHRNEPAGRHKEKSSKFHLIHEAVLHSEAHEFAGAMQV